MYDKSRLLILIIFLWLNEGLVFTILKVMSDVIFLKMLSNALLDDKYFTLLQSLKTLKFENLENMFKLNSRHHP